MQEYCAMKKNIFFSKSSNQIKVARELENIGFIVTTQTKECLLVKTKGDKLFSTDTTFPNAAFLMSYLFSSIFTMDFSVFQKM